MSDDVLERVCMCVAEAGYDPDLVKRGSRDVGGKRTIEFSHPIPPEVAWRAREMVGQHHSGRITVGPMCFACSEPIFRAPDDVMAHHLEACVATEWLTLDCGRPR